MYKYRNLFKLTAIALPLTVFPLFKNKPAKADELKSYSFFDPSSYFRWNKTPKKLEDELKTNSSTKSVRKGVVESYSSCYYQANKQLEDTFKVQIEGDQMVFGVFDGHSGTAASFFCRDRLIPFLFSQWKKNKATPLLNEKAFLKADESFLAEKITDNDLTAARSGACVAIAHINKDDLTVANLGDCKCILAEENSSGKITARVLSTDHLIAENEEVRGELLQNHPYEQNIIWHDRVKGRLQPARGIGDGMYKREEVYNSLRNKRSPDEKWKVPYTSAKPSLTKEKISSKTRFMVLVTDGISDEMNAQLIVDNVAKNVGQGENESKELIIRSLQRAAERRYGNQGEKELSMMLEAPRGKDRRSLHDDMTALVIVFAKDKCYNCD